MKKYTSIICTMAVLLMASAVTFVSCSKDEEPTVSGKFTLTVNASKGAQATKDLSLDDEHNVLTASWKQGEKVYVHNNTTGEDLDGYLEAQSNGVNTVLKGSLTGDIAVGDELSLRFCSSDNYTSQQGTIEWIAENCDLATATVEVTDISTPSVTTSDADFANQQAIVKFSLRNARNTDDLSATQLVVNVGGTDYTITPASDTNVFYVALPGFSNQTVTLTATVGGDTYISNAVPGITFADGQYYTVAVGMKAPCSYTAPTLVSGTLTYNGSAQALVTGGSVTNATIYYSTNGGSSWSTSVPTGTNAGDYTVYYKVVPNDGYAGGVESTSLGIKNIAKAAATLTCSNGAISFSSSDATNSTKTRSASCTGGTINVASANTGNCTVSYSSGTITVTRKNNSAFTNTQITVSVTPDGNHTAPSNVRFNVSAVAYAKPASSATSSDKGKLIGRDGRIYDNVAAASAAGTTAVAKIIYIGATGNSSYNHGLALALTDEGEMAWDAAMTACNNKNTSTPVTGATWLLASKDQWNYMLGASGAGSGSALRDGFSGITGASNLVNDDYWSSTLADSNYPWEYWFYNDTWYTYYKTNNVWVRACLAF